MKCNNHATTTSDYPSIHPCPVQKGIVISHSIAAPIFVLKVGVLGTAVATITKVAMCSYVNKMLLIATMAEYKLEVSYNIPSIIMITRTTGMAISSSQTKVSTWPVQP